MRCRRLFVSGALVCLGTTAVMAADVATLATLAVQGAVVGLAREYGAATGHQVNLTFDTGPNLARRIGAGEATDVVIAPAAVVEQAVKDGRVLAETRADVGRIAVGVAVRKGVAPPDISSVDALRRALTTADAVVYSQGTSGVYIEKLLGDLGLTEALRGKALRLPNGGAAMARIVSGRGNDIGFTMVSEIRLYEPKGAVLVGPLPAAVQNYTTYTAAVLTASPNRAAASGFVQYLVTPAARRAFAATGWE